MICRRCTTQLEIIMTITSTPQLGRGDSNSLRPGIATQAKASVSADAQETPRNDPLGNRVNGLKLKANVRAGGRKWASR